MKVVLGISCRHIHLNKEDYKILFQKEEMEKIEDISQPGQYKSPYTVSIKTSKNIIDNVRVLGPIRDYTQFELSKTESIFLGINPPIAASGDLENAKEVEIIGPCATIKRKCAIIADRHIHITQEQKKELGLDDVDEVSVVFESEKTTVFSNVKLKVCEEAKFELHLDTDDANGALLKPGDYGTIIKMQKFH